ncbi:hypothetical protein [Nonomuraea sp. SYSU D8015]|nr:hypothetical protein [Nonomuraea sp. SYSU D8015]
MLRTIADNPHGRIRDIAKTIGITERAGAGIIGDLREIIAGLM